MADGPGAKFEEMVALRDRGVLAPGEFDTWRLRNFSSLPGTHLNLRKTKGPKWELVTSEGTVWAQCRGGSFTHFHQLWRGISVQGQGYRWRGFAKTLRKSHELVASSTSEVAVRMTGTHFNKKATTRVELIDQDTYAFPVNNGMMSALDSSGKILAQYRLDRSRIKVNQDPRKIIEVVVDPCALAIPDFELVVAVSTLFLSRFSEAPIGRSI